MAETEKRYAPPGLLSGILFFAVVLLGSGYIVIAKMQGVGAIFVTLVPVVIMVAYAALLGFARLFRLRDDQSGDNLYYMGFLFTLTSLAVSLYQFSSFGSAEQIVQNFGIAIASTIAGISLRIFFNQMRRDPVEVEYAARQELAEAARRVRRELDSTVLEFSHFRRATQQSMAEAIEEVNEMLKEAKDRFVLQLDDFATSSSRPIADASKRSSERIAEINIEIAGLLEEVAKRVSSEGQKLSVSTSAITKSIDNVVSRLSAMQTPDQVIEIKLNPTIQGLSRAVNNFGKSAEAQSKVVDDNLRQTQELSKAVSALLTEIKAVNERRAQTFSNPPPADFRVVGGQHEIKDFRKP